MIFVSLLTDWLRYKIVIVIQALCGVGIYALLSFCTSFLSVIVSIITNMNIFIKILTMMVFLLLDRPNFVWYIYSY